MDPKPVTLVYKLKNRCNHCNLFESWMLSKIILKIDKTTRHMYLKGLFFLPFILPWFWPFIEVWSFQSFTPNFTRKALCLCKEVVKPLILCLKIQQKQLKLLSVCLTMNFRGGAEDGVPRSRKQGSNFVNEEDTEVRRMRKKKKHRGKFS